MNLDSHGEGGGPLAGGNEESNTVLLLQSTKVYMLKHGLQRSN